MTWPLFSIGARDALRERFWTPTGGMCFFYGLYIFFFFGFDHGLNLVSFSLGCFYHFTAFEELMAACTRTRVAHLIWTCESLGTLPADVLTDRIFSVFGWSRYTMLGVGEIYLLGESSREATGHWERAIHLLSRLISCWVCLYAYPTDFEHAESQLVRHWLGRLGYGL